MQPHDDISENTFENVFTSLSKNIKRENKATPELNSIVADGLHIAREVDTLYESQGSFSKLNRYLLYQIVFRLWSYQHKIFLENLEAFSRKDFSNNVEIVLRHKMIAINLFQSLQNLENVTDKDTSRHSWLQTWNQAISDISDFLRIPINPSKRSKQKTIRFSLNFSQMSPESLYAIIATFTFVLGILIATLLLIR